MKTLCALCLSTGLIAASCGSDTPGTVADVESTIAENLDESTSEDLTDEAAAAAGSLRSELENVDTSELSTLMSSLDLVLLEELVGEEPFTLFAPSDGAFASLEADDLTSLLANPAMRRSRYPPSFLYSTVYPSATSAWP